MGTETVQKTNDPNAAGNGRRTATWKAIEVLAHPIASLRKGAALLRLKGMDEGALLEYVNKHERLDWTVQNAVADKACKALMVRESENGAIMFLRSGKFTSPYAQAKFAELVPGTGLNIKGIFETVHKIHLSEEALQILLKHMAHAYMEKAVAAQTKEGAIFAMERHEIFTELGASFTTGKKQSYAFALALMKQLHIEQDELKNFIIVRDFEASKGGLPGGVK